MCCLVLTMQAQQKEHVVQRGEDFTTIARKYAISEQELKDANPTSKVCYAGLKLIIPMHGVPVERKEVTPKPIDIELLSSDDDILTKSSATTYQVGHSLWREHNYMGAFVYLHAALRDGDKRAYYPLGNCYAQDSVQCYNIDNAVNYYRLAISETKDKSEEGYWMACGALASLYMEGRGVDKDLNQAKKLCAEYQRYADTDNKKDADKLLNSIKAEERAIAERVAAEKRAAQQLAAAERRKAQQQAAEERRKAQQQATAQKRAAQQQAVATRQQPKQQNVAVAQINNTTQNNEVPFPGYNRVTGGLPQVGETRYWNKSGTYGYCSIYCYRTNDGTILYQVSGEPIDLQHPMPRYIYQCQENGWNIYKRVNVRVTTNYAAFPRVETLTFYDPISGQLRISTDGNTVITLNGTRYDTPIDQTTANALSQAQRDFIARGIGSGAIMLENKPSDVEQQLKNDIDEIDRKQADRQREEREVREQRGELLRGHRTTVYKSTNTDSTPTVWCNICNRWDKPHSHPISK